MHQSVMLWGQEQLTWERVLGKRVLEVGSLNVNGSWDELIRQRQPKEFIRTDMREGPGVDEAVACEDLIDWSGDRRWDLVVCTEMLEHAENWQNCVAILKSLLEPQSGELLLTTRSPGFPLHDFPGDFWRFTPQTMFGAFADMEHGVVNDWQDPGVFVFARMPRREGYEKDPVFDVEAFPVIPH